MRMSDFTYVYVCDVGGVVSLTMRMSDFTHVYVWDVGGVDLHYDLRSNCRQMSQITSVHVAAFKLSAVITISNQN